MKRFAMFCICLCTALSQSIAQKKAVNLTDVKFTVAEAPEWSALLKRNSGWFGGDGIYTIPMNGVEGKYTGPNSKTLFIFSDSMVGEIRENTLMPGYRMIHNSAAVLNGNKPVTGNMKFYWNTDEKNGAESLFVPATPKADSTDYYWLGDGFVNQANKATYIFGYRVRNMYQGPFGFREVGNTLIKLTPGTNPPYKANKQMDTPFYLTDGKDDIGSYGAAVYVNTKAAGAATPDGYIYIYGVRGLAKNLYAARVLPTDFENFKKWRFWDGKAWVAEIDKAAVLTTGVSNELSISALPDGRYALVFQQNGMSTTVGMRIGASPIGPFGPIIKLWDCQPDLTEKTFVVYNAKAHPTLSKPGELIISYNINSVEFDKDLKKHPNLYRPRFIRVKFN
ncbi:DUF4185 domain-containing protein [Mucilaginibacter lutimaris]|uniref:DUF4185 domain-containing protein n=1 Tax=Mucilaginibacter lutimaris TaxID=931629 RepID=A0ABW2ZA28_9SPHI